MSKFYSVSTGGFYDDNVHGKNIPEDSISITESQYATLISGQSKGRVISSTGGKVYLAEPPDLTTYQIKIIYENAIQNTLEEQAKSWGYDSVISCLSYLNSTNPKWKNEATAINEWRDNVWIWANEQMAIIMDDNSLLPKTPALFVKQMPKSPTRPTQEK